MASRHSGARGAAGKWDRDRLQAWLTETRELVSHLTDLDNVPHTEIRTLLLGVARALDGQPPSTALVRNPDQPIRIQTLGGFALTIDGEPLPAMRKQPRKPLKLLKALIARGGHNVSVDALCSDLWPEADGATAIQTMNVTLHRLRKLLKLRDALQVQAGHLSLNPQLCWVDAEVFEQSLSKLDSADTEPAHASGNAERFDTAFDMYQGAFLPEEDARWAAATRERLRSRFVRAVRTYAERCEKLGQSELAIPVYQRAIEIDPLAEELYRRLMQVYDAMGAYSDAVSLYRRCRIVLSKMLDVTPSSETRHLYSAIRQKTQRINEARAALAAERGLPADGTVTIGGETYSGVLPEVGQPNLRSS
jgi:DNA-binding SARP family transcriptional activator